jgi:uncharacterized protein involved in exopolysaccharide biosynthesis
LSSNDSAAERDEINLIAIWNILWRYKYLIGAMTLIVAAIGVAVALTETEIFRAEAVVTEVSARRGTEAVGGQLGGLMSMVGVNLGARSGEAQEARAILNTHRLAEAFIQRYGLINTLMEGAEEAPEIWYAVQIFRNSVLLIHDGSSAGTTVVAMNWTDPVVAARWANDYVALANEVIRARAMEESKRNIEYLTEQLPKTNVVEVQRVMYNLIETETKSLMIATGRPEYAFTIIDPAVPPKERARPYRTLIVLVGAVIGMFLGVGLAFARDAFVRDAERRGRLSPRS